MNCCITDLRNKDVIDKQSGCRLGNVCDVEVDTCCGKVVSIVVIGRVHCFGLLGRDDLRIPWEDIDVIGDDIILVCMKNCPPRNQRQRRRQGGFTDNFFR